MCGICGIIHGGDEEILTRMTDVISHRGPDDYGIEWFKERGSGLGHRRLSIIDLSPMGHQPMKNDRENLWLTFNGEIYNYKEIRKELSIAGVKFTSQCDTEVLLKAYEHWGSECLSRLNGQFAFAVFDKEKNKLFAARDRIGVKPFYYTEVNSTLLFSSEIKSLLVSNLVEKEPDYYALNNPTRYQISPYTGFKDIFKLPPGHFLTFESEILKIERYWDITPTENNGLTETDIFEQLDDLLNDSVSLQMTSDVPVGVLLSGVSYVHIYVS